MQTSIALSKTPRTSSRRSFREQEAFKATQGKRNKTQRNQRQEWN
ncbi:hypothetical protein [Pseudomonas oryzihabitans]|nr:MULTISPECIES: hypothetical protein [Pseudomonas]